MKYETGERQTWHDDCLEYFNLNPNKKEDIMERQTGFEVNSKKKGGEIMKKALLLTTMVVLLAAPAMALNIKTSKHNLGTTQTEAAYGQAAGTSQICIFCHTPHNAVQNIPLWNRSNPSGAGFATYTASPSLNIDAADRGTISGDSISLFCLSCHDGAAALATRVANRAGQTLTEDVAMRSYAAIGSAGSSSLTNDHPVNFSYAGVTAGADRGSDADFNDGAIIVGIKFFRSTKSGSAKTDYVECASCHDPHGTNNGSGVRVAKFLRKTNDSSSLCLSCHKK